METQVNPPRRSRWDIVITAIVIFVIVQGANFYFKSTSDKKYNKEIEDAKEQIIILEHEIKQRITEMEKLGGNVEDLQNAIKQLEVEKQTLISENKYSIRQRDALRDKVEGFQELLVMKDEEIKRLNEINQALVTENTGLKTETNKLTQALTKEQQNREVLESKVAVAERLKVENIKISAVNSRGKVRQDEFKSRFISKIRVEFNIADNPIAPVEGKDIMIRIVGPNDNVLFDVAKGAGTFLFDGREEFYTLKQQILFDNSLQKLVFEYEKGSEYEPGRYQITVYTDDYIMGEQAFLIK